MKQIVVITGPTASGKTGVAIELAEMINGEIINADSMQVFKYCNIGSAKTEEQEKKNIKHHLIDIIEPFESFSIAQYKLLAEKSIKKVFELGKVPVITGGTGLYIEALIKNIDFSTENDNSSIRAKYNKILEEKGEEYLYGLLQKRDADACLKLHPNNSRRVIRYLEILDSYDGTMEEYRKASLEIPPEYDYKIFILMPERDHLYSLIEKRVERMIEKGLVEEVKNLLASGIEENAQAMQGIGYKETIMYLSGLVNYSEFIRILIRNTRRYAKRQYTWCRRYKTAKTISTTDFTDNRAMAAYIYKDLYQ